MLALAQAWMAVPPTNALSNANLQVLMDAAREEGGDGAEHGQFSGVRTQLFGFAFDNEGNRPPGRVATSGTSGYSARIEKKYQRALARFPTLNRLRAIGHCSPRCRARFCISHLVLTEKGGRRVQKVATQAAVGVTDIKILGAISVPVPLANRNRPLVSPGAFMLLGGWLLAQSCSLLPGVPLAVGEPQRSLAGPQADPLDQGYRDMYNLDFSGAHAHFASWMQTHPQDPLGPASDAAAFLFSEFDRLGIIDVQLFADDSRFDSRSKLTPDPAVRKAFEDRADQTNRLADAALAKNSKDANALYAKTLVCGMRSDYALMIEKRDVEALSFSKQATALSRQTLAIAPTMYDAYLAAGVENYMLSLKFAPLRWVLSWTGAGTNRAEGIRLLHVTASQGHYLAPFARMMLAVAAIRDGQLQQARDILTALAKEFPRNSLYTRERDRIH
jgi:hypothetical protein